MKISLNYHVLFYTFWALLLTNSISVANELRQKVLVLHSYHQGLEWTDKITKGIQEVFKPFELEFELYYEYLDTKRNAGEAYMASLYHLQQAKLKNNKFSAVIVADNNALTFIVEHGVELFGESPVVFCGINNFTPEILEKHSNITGIVERTDYAGNLNLIRQLHPERINIKVILDRTPTGDAIFEDLKTILPQFPDLTFSFYRDFLLTEVESQVAEFSSHDVIYLLTFNRDRNDNFISYREGIKMIREASKVPIYGSWDFYLGKGLVGGIITRGKDQGRRAGEMVLDILQGTPVSSIPVDYDGATVPVFDYRELEQFAISSINSLPEGSLLINTPPTLMEKSSKYVIFIAGLLLVISSILGTRIFLIRRRNYRLLEEKKALDATIKQQTQELELEKLQSKLAQIDKMDAIGQLAGGIAHDFNNMVGGIMGAAELLSFNLDSEDRTREYLNIIMEASSKAAGLTEKLLAFARNSPNTSIPVNIHKTISDTIALLANTIDKRIHLSQDLNAKYCTVIGDPSQLQNVFINMGINSSHAIDGNGEISFTTKNITLDSKFCEASSFDLKPGEYLSVEIHDTGVGIPRDKLPKVFEPFFTTKEEGKGTGLGLASAYGTIQQHNGSITVYSEVGKGTIFRLLLPFTDVPIEPQDEVEIKPGTGCILIADDDTIMRTISKAVLEELGYEVIQAKNGQEAVDLFFNDREKIDLVMLDMIMPVMNGRDSFKKIRAIAPEAVVVLCSGFSKEVYLRDMKLSGLNGYIQKPFMTAELSQVIYNALHDRKGFIDEGS